MPFTNPALDCFVANAPRNDGTFKANAPRDDGTVWLRATLSLRAKHIGPRVRCNLHRNDGNIGIS